MQRKSLQQLLAPEQVGRDRFRGESLDIGGKSVFGGQVLGQALAAANHTVAGRHAHSLHAYFLLPGDMEVPIDYVVERVRDGRSFSTRSIQGLQHGKAIFSMTASYQVDEAGFEHQAQMPEVPAPEELPSLSDIARGMAPDDPERVRRTRETNLPMEFRPVEPANPLSREKYPPHQKIWFRILDPLPDDGSVQQCALAYASDFSPLHAARFPHGISFRQRNMQVASLDHALWFYRPCRVDQWLLYVTESPCVCGGRGFVRGDIFSRDGRLVASMAQEGLMRVLPE